LRANNPYRAANLFDLFALFQPHGFFHRLNEITGPQKPPPKPPSDGLCVPPHLCGCHGKGHISHAASRSLLRRSRRRRIMDR